MKRSWKMCFMDTIYVFLVGNIWCASAASFNEAPGTIILKIGFPELTESCFTEDCQFIYEFCIGSGRSQNERCSWIPIQIFNGSYFENKAVLIEQSFKIDNIRESFYFNANFTFSTSNKDSQTLRFQDNLCQYSSHNSASRLSLHSQNFASLGIEIDIKCKENYYPQFQCTKHCLEEQHVNKCDNNGSKVCLEGYTLSTPIDRCVKDICKSSGNLCDNNSTCLNGLNSITCLCQPNYTGTMCDVWDPCQGHKCLNSGICIKRTLPKDYECQCNSNYKGTYCEDFVDPCQKLSCPLGAVCRRDKDKASCIEPSKSDSDFDFKRYILSRRNSATEVSISTVKVTPTRINKSEVKLRETVKLVQNPVQKDFTTMAIIIVLLVVMICGFAGTFWIQRLKYLQKNKKCVANQAFLSKLSIMHMPNYNASKRWHSVDGATLKILHQAQNYGYPTMYYNSSLNPREDVENHYGTSRNSFTNWQPSLIARIPSTNRSSINNDEPIDVSYENEPNNEESVMHLT